MVLAKSKNAVGLGNSLMNDRFGKGKGSDQKKVSAGIQRTGVGGETYVTNAHKEASWVKMRSVTEQPALDEFLSTAELAGTDFTAEKMNNVKIIHTDQRNPYLLSAKEERATVRKHNANKGRLTVPRRPPWDEKTTPQELDARERESLLDWRRGLAELQESNDLLMTPFERNLEVWRQLWRVIERSDLVVQIVDARNPLLFRSEDLENYVKEVDPRKNNLLLVNKADMMTLEQREAWADYFEIAGINYKFFSASLAKEMNEARDLEDSDEDAGKPLPEDKAAMDPLIGEAKKLNIGDAKGGDEQPVSEEDLDSGEKEEENEAVEKKEEEDEDDDEVEDEDYEEEDNEEETGNREGQRTRILTVDELESLFLLNAPAIRASSSSDFQGSQKIQIGLVGYPNVGKSSTINALIGAKKVSVSSTPGKTKHFQTIHLSPSVLLCDCPGLVFPNFATTKAELVCSGILPIDQLREFAGPSGLVARRIPQAFVEAIYGMRIYTRPLEEGGNGIPTADELLTAYAIARGFATTGQGQPDISRAARYILKDYVSGKLLFCHPPPTDPPTDPAAFNAALYNAAHLPPKRRAIIAARARANTTGENTNELSAMNGESHIVDEEQTDGKDDALPASNSSSQPLPQGAKGRRLDRAFFGAGAGNAGHLSMPFNHVYSEQGRVAATKALEGMNDGTSKLPSGRKMRSLVALERGVDPADVMRGGKKHFKGGEKRKGKRAQAGKFGEQEKWNEI